MKLLAAHAVSNPDTANYWCTWLSQAWFARPEDAPATESEAGRLLVQMRKRLDEDFLFGSLGLATKCFQGIRSDLIIVLDDGWDVFAQDLLSDDDAVNISEAFTRTSHAINLPGELISRIGLSMRRHAKDSSDPGLVLQIT